MIDHLPRMRVLLRALKGIFGSTTVLDLFVWETEETFVVGIQVSPKLFNRYLPDFMFERAKNIDARFQRALGFEVEIEPRWGNLRSPVGQTMGDSATLGEIFDGLETSLGVYAGQEEKAEVRIVLSPYKPTCNPGLSYLSVKTGKMAVMGKVKGALQTPEGPGLHPCEYGQKPLDLGTRQTDSGQLVLTPALGLRAFVTHCVDLEGEALDLDVARKVKKCGGMLFPSLAVGDRPMVGFGRLVLVADTALIDVALKGKDALLYATDVWTETTRDFLNEHSRRLYEQVTGRWRPDIYTSHNHLATLGPRRMDDPIQNEKRFLRALSARIRRYSKATSEEEVEVLKEGRHGSDDWYPYMELKAHRILPMTTFPLAVCPAQDKKRAMRWLRAAGFMGEVIGLRNVAQDLWQYGAQVSEAVLERAEPARRRNGSTVTLYHGTHRWEGPPTLQPAGIRKSEHGSGLYLTFDPEPARRYAKGGGYLMQFEVDADLRWLEGVRIPLNVAEDFVLSRVGLRNRKALLADLRTHSDRMGHGEVLAAAVENLMHNHGALKGEHGPALARFFVSLGIDASRVSQSGGDWVVLYNLDKIRRWGRVTTG